MGLMLVSFILSRSVSHQMTSRRMKSLLNAPGDVN